MEPLVRVKMAIYAHFARAGKRPSVAEVGEAVGLDRSAVLDAYRGLAEQRVLVLEADAHGRGGTGVRAALRACAC